VRGRTFAYYLVDHRGNEGIEGLVGKVRPGENEALIERDPERYYRPAYMAHHGWVGLRLDLPAVDWAEVEELAVESYLLVAPKRLAAAVREAS
jgi:hypothetical protein